MRQVSYYNENMEILSFISLPTVPGLGLTDKVLIDVLEHKLVELEVDGWVMIDNRLL